MAILKNSIEIKTTPDKIFKWLKNLDKHYKEWHPDHVKWINLTGSLDKGDIFYSEEYLHGKLHKLKGKITKIEENKRVKYKFLFPTSIISPKGSFIIELKTRVPSSLPSFLLDLAGYFQNLPKIRLKLVKPI